MTPPPLRYHLCPHCFRATPAAARERFCPNDGTPLLTTCPRCGAAIASPYGRYCPACGRDFVAPGAARPQRPGPSLHLLSPPTATEAPS